MKKYLVLTVSTLFVFNGLITGQSSLQLQLTEYMQKVRSEKMPPVAPQNLYQNNQPNEMLTYLKDYYNDSITDVRRKAYYLTYRTGIENKQSAQQSIIQLTDGLNDENTGIAGSVLDYLKEFRNTDFTEEARKRIADLLRQEMPHYKKLIKITGFLNLQEQKDYLKTMLLNQEYSGNSERWAINLALARMGDADAINFCLSTVKQMPVNDDLIYEIVPDLIYTRQKQIIDYLITLLMSDEKNCYSANPESAGKIRCGYRIMEYLAPVIKNFPLQTDPGGEIVTKNYKEALKISRDWFNQHKEDYQMIMEKY